MRDVATVENESVGEVIGHQGSALSGPFKHWGTNKCKQTEIRARAPDHHPIDRVK